MNFPHIQIGPVLLIHGDARDVLPELEEKADLLCTDVPYKLTSGGNATQVMSGKFSKEEYDNSGDLMETVKWSEIGGPCFRACKPDADAYVMTNDKNQLAAQQGFQGSGWKFHNMLVWGKGSATRNRWYMKNLEFTIYLWKGEARVINNPGSKQLFLCRGPKDAIHPTQKPVELMLQYIENSTDPGGLVLDPFAGSGTTLMAAMYSGRRAIGIEIDEEHFNNAARRLSVQWEEMVTSV